MATLSVRRYGPFENPFTTVTVPPSGFVTVILPFAPLPPLPVTLIVSWVDDTLVTELTEPLTLIETVTPTAKLVPVMVQLPVPLWPGLHGLAEVGAETVGPDLTVNDC